MKLRNQVMLSFFLVFVPLTLGGSLFIYKQVSQVLQTSAQRERQNTTESLSKLIRTAASVSVRNRLRAIAEKNQEIAGYYYSKYRTGLISRAQAIQTIEDTFLSQRIGLSGYIYCLDTRANVVIHPFDKVRGTNVSVFDFARKQVEQKEGYIEYEWKNPGEDKKRPKALYMTYFEPLDWIISVSTYREEFNHLVAVDDFRDSILTYKFGDSGYAYVFDREGNILVHPWLRNQNMLNYNDASAAVATRIISQKRGTLTYFWQNPGETAVREKIATFDSLPEYGWFVVSSSYVKEVHEPLQSLARTLLLIFVSLFSIATLLTILISISITRPLETFIQKLETGAEGNYSIRMHSHRSNEMGRLSRCFNHFMDRLENYHEQIGKEIERHLRTQSELKQSELKLKALFDQSFQFSAILTPEGYIESTNQTALNFAGCTAGDLKGKFLWESPFWRHEPDTKEMIKASIQKAARGELVRFETTNISADDEIRHIDYSIKPVVDKTGRITFLIPEGRDITELKQSESDKIKLEAKLFEAQKMESIGTLAGGIAHNFNNILMGIQGRASLMKMNENLSPNDEKHLSGIESSVQNAVCLTRQLLAFARGGMYKLSPTNINALIHHENQMFGETRKEIRIHESLDRDLWQANVDQGQIQQVLLNLYVNAWQAMLHGGDLYVETRNITITPGDHLRSAPAQGTEIPPGSYVRIAVTDTGSGMEEDIINQIFDPFFTTKEPGSGTGLGLASVYGIIKSHDGYIHVDSRTDEGTTFTLYLPAVDHFPAVAAAETEITRIKPGEGTLLLVDDEEIVRKVTRQMLEKLGYTVITAETGETALERYRENMSRIDLVVMDMIMPGMGGGEAFSLMKKMNPQVKVLLASGYSINENTQRIMDLGCQGFIQKPFTLQKLSGKIREALVS